MNAREKKIIIFASGSGTNAENIIKYFQNSSVSVAAVFSNKEKAKVLSRAKKYAVKTHLFTKEELYNGKVIELLANYNPDLIVLAGFLLKFPVTILQKYPNKIINIHPSLLPKYGGKGMYGRKVHEAVVKNLDKETGITIHYVNEHYDEGKIIFQKKIALTKATSVEEIETRIHTLEYKFFPKIITQLLK